MIFERREASKEYLAIVIGWPDADEWECAEPILRAGEIGPSPIWVRQIVHPAGRECRTRFRVERRFERGEGRFSLIRCFPETGRMHQIRVHLAHSGHAILGDKLYSGSGGEYLEWMAKGWSPGLKAKLAAAPPRAARRQLGAAMGAGAPSHGRRTLARDLADFVEGREIDETPGVVIWSRHD